MGEVRNAQVRELEVTASELDWRSTFPAYLSTLPQAGVAQEGQVQGGFGLPSSHGAVPTSAKGGFYL